MAKRRVGIVGYGHLGKYLAEAILNDATASKQFELAFVWNRSPEKIGPEISRDIILTNLDDFASFRPDLIVEVAHPNITVEYGARFVSVADYFVRSFCCFESFLIIWSRLGRRPLLPMPPSRRPCAKRHRAPAPRTVSTSRLALSGAHRCVLLLFARCPFCCILIPMRADGQCRVVLCTLCHW